MAYNSQAFDYNDIDVDHEGDEYASYADSGDEEASENADVDPVTGMGSIPLEELERDELPPHDMLFAAIMEWGADLRRRIEDDGDQEGVWKLKGGWEGWLQPELAQIFNAEREKAVYVEPPGTKHPRAADLVLAPENDDKMDNAYLLEWETVIIELKCQGFYNQDNFANAVEADVVKIQDEIRTEYTRHGCSLYVVALSMTPEADEEMVMLGMREYRESEGLDVPFRLWWCNRLWGRNGGNGRSYSRTPGVMCFHPRTKTVE
ncbi:hypothetical protein K458DRAFT_147979 [Lentithecium fluviatile CBS 122367]|uniref:Uncharacterized protein n=1 Tax=Lentithecium fluviatile CBS 122367 TaxID=1168545 RepID=A0A6G1JDX6_9PLEO|nr:hypothetical protein K458DRAFT_147979 [Lentithecium fluviatile CBS 122367]